MSEQPAPPETDPTWWQTFRAAPRVLRWSAYAVVGIATFVVLLLVVTVAFALRPVPATTGEVEVPGLGAEVEVIRDAHGIAQVYADTDADLLRAQGYVHAQERFFEMDVRRHVTSGRLSELFGEDGLETDKVIRTMGWRRVAEQELAILDTETRAALASYAEGVNAYLESHGPTEMAVEYTLLAATGLSYEPEPWTPVDSLAWLKAMAWDLRGNMTDEVDRVLASLDHTPEEVDRLYPEYPYDRHPPIVGSGGVVDGVFEQNASGNATRNPRRPAYSREMVDALEGVRDAVARVPDLMGRGDGIGSNSWVVDGEHSATGAPLLANDPHLGVSMPGIWLQMGLHCRQITPDCTLDSSGFTFSGVPGVIIGHNADIAWGFTNLGPDVTDLYLEKVEGESWLQDGEAQPLDIRTETIEVRGGDDFELQIRETGHGPLISDVSQEFSSVGANAPTDEPDATGRGNGYGVALAVDRARARHDRRRDPRPQPGEQLGRVPGGRRRLRGPGAEPRVRRPRGPHRLPGAGADPDPQVRQRRPDAGRGMGVGQRLDRRVRPVRRPAERAGPGGGLRGHGQPGRHRARLPLLPHR